LYWHLMVLGVYMFVGKEIMEGYLPLGLYSSLISLAVAFATSCVGLIGAEAEVSTAWNVVTKLNSLAAIEGSKFRRPGAAEAVAKEGVKFESVTREPDVRNVSFELFPGQTIAIVGPTGSGKTKLMELLVGFDSPDSGTIRSGSRDVTTFGEGWVEEAVSFVGHDVALFYGRTLAENIAGSRNFSQKVLEDVLRRVAVTKIAGQPKDLASLGDVVIGHGEGSWLPEFSMQRKIALARALYKDAPLYLLQEPTNRLDMFSEQAVLTELKELAKRGKIVVVSTGRLQIVQQADVVIVMKHGKVVEIGSHDDLVNNSAIYKEMASFG